MRENLLGIFSCETKRAGSAQVEKEGCSLVVDDAEKLAETFSWFLPA